MLSPPYYYAHVLAVYGMDNMDNLVNNHIKTPHLIEKEFHFHLYTDTWLHDNVLELKFYCSTKITSLIHILTVRD